jgi:hypothetical protein
MAEVLKRPPMCPTCAQAALGSLVQKRQAAASEGDRPGAAALDQQITRMLSWSYPCREPGLPPTITLGEIVTLREAT